MRTDRSSFRPDCLAGKVAFVTGGGSGICKNVARQLLLHGADVVIASRNTKKLDAAAQSCISTVKGFALDAVAVLQALSAETGRRCFAVAMDVRDEAQVVAAVGKALQEVRTIDILINGAGGNFLCSAAELKYKGFKAVMEIDAHGTFIVSKTIFDMCFKPEAHRWASQLAKNPSLRSGTTRLPPKVIINISATLHYTATVLQAHAGAAKAAVDALTRHLAVEWGPYNIRVNCVAPGPIRGTVGFSKLSPYGKSGKRVAIGEQPTNHDSQLNPLEGDRSRHNVLDENSTATTYEHFSQFVPLQRLGLPDDVAYATLFLCLPEASLITGACLVVDGGQWMTSGNFTVLEPSLNKRWREAPYESAKL